MLFPSRGPLVAGGRRATSWTWAETASVREGRHAGYPGEPLMAGLEERCTHYVARVRNTTRSRVPATSQRAQHHLSRRTTPMGMMLAHARLSEASARSGGINYTDHLRTMYTL